MITGGDGSNATDSLIKVELDGSRQWTVDNSSFHTADIIANQSGGAILIGANGIRIINQLGQTTRNISMPGGGYAADIYPDGSFVAGGYINNGPSWLQCLDAEGTILWDIRLGENYTEIHDVRITRTGSIVAVTTGGRSFLVSQQGQLLWDSGGQGEYRAIRALDSAPDGTLAFTYSGQYAASTSDPLSLYSSLQDVSATFANPIDRGNSLQLTDSGWLKDIAIDIAPQFQASSDPTFAIRISDIIGDAVLGCVYVTGNASVGTDSERGEGGGSNVGCFIAKYDSSGSLLWSRSIENSNLSVVDGERPLSISTTGLVGWGYNDTSNFESTIYTYEVLGNDGTVLHANSASGQASIMSTRGYGWMPQLVENSAIDSNGFSYVVTGFPASAYVETLSKYDPTGQLLWSETLGDYGVSGITIDPLGGVYLTGAYDYQSTGGNSGQILHVNSDGAVSSFANTYSYGVQDLEVASNGDVLAGGMYLNGPAYIKSYTNSGTLLWATSIGTNYTEIRDLELKSDGSILALTNRGIIFELSNTGTIIAQWADTSPLDGDPYQLESTESGLYFARGAKLGLSGTLQGVWDDPTGSEEHSAPTDLTLTSSGIAENSTAGTLIGTLTASDPDAGSTFTYALASGTGDTDNTLVEIVGSEVRVRSGGSIDFETNPTLNLRIQVSDNTGVTYSKAVTASVIDVNETPGVTITGTDTTTGEDGNTAVFSVVLRTAPVNNVTINFAVSDATEASLSTPSLTFSASNWSTPQGLTVTGLDDYENDGDIAYNLFASIATADLSYKRIVIPNLAITNADDGLDEPIYWYGTDGIDYKNGGNGDDRLYARGNMDELKGGRGNDRLYGQEDDDYIYGEEGDDLLYGGYDDDFLSGGKGNDELYGEGGNDRLEGGDGNDLIDGGIGADTMIGGAGNDIYYVDNSNDMIIDLGLSTDIDTVIIFSATSYTLAANVENASLDTSSTTVDIIGNELNNSLSGNISDNHITGGGGDDNLSGGGGNDEMYGGDGNDVVDAGTGDDLIIGGNGAGDDRYDGGSGIDSVRYTSALAAITVNLTTGSATSTARRDTAKIGTDILTNIESIIAGNFNDTLIGNNLNNAIDGQGGIDLITGGLGADRLTGGAGVDTFRIALTDSRLDAYDVITDLLVGTDKIDGPTRVSAADLKELGTVSSMTQTGISTLLKSTVFVRNSAATFTYGTGLAARTFLALNDGIAGFDSTKDSLVEITGYSGLLTNLAIV